MSWSIMSELAPIDDPIWDGLKDMISEVFRLIFQRLTREEVIELHKFYSELA